MTRTIWSGSAKIITCAFNAFTNGLTSSMPASTDKNVDMLIGGQAVIEGVMMRSLSGYSVAVRQPDGGIAIKKDALVSVTTKYPLLKTPVLRGSVVLIQSLILGVRALNTFLTMCRGQRMGIFAGSGVGKSTLLGMMARYCNADVVVIGLIGERGREVQEFLQDDLGAAGLARSVGVVATSGQRPLGGSKRASGVSFRFAWVAGKRRFTTSASSGTRPCRSPPAPRGG